MKGELVIRVLILCNCVKMELLKAVYEINGGSHTRLPFLQFPFDARSIRFLLYVWPPLSNVDVCKARSHVDLLKVYISITALRSLVSVAVKRRQDDSVVCDYSLIHSFKWQVHIYRNILMTTGTVVNVA